MIFRTGLPAISSGQKNCSTHQREGIPSRLLLQQRPGLATRWLEWNRYLFSRQGLRNTIKKAAPTILTMESVTKDLEEKGTTKEKKGKKKGTPIFLSHARKTNMSGCPAFFQLMIKPGEALFAIVASYIKTAFYVNRCHRWRQKRAFRLPSGP